MVRYLYLWPPLVILGAVVVLSAPWLALIALAVVAIVALGALAGLAWAIVLVPYWFVGAIGRRWHMSGGATPRRATAPSPATRQTESEWQGALAHPAPVSFGRQLQAPQHSFREGRVS
jgi:hypothetical protein